MHIKFQLDIKEAIAIKWGNMELLCIVITAMDPMCKSHAEERLSFLQVAKLEYNGI